MATKLGDALKGAREAKGLRKAEVARRLKISSSAVSQWESGGTKPDLDNFLRLAQSYELVISNPPFREYYIEKTGVDPSENKVNIAAVLALETGNGDAFIAAGADENVRLAPEAPAFESLNILTRDIPVLGTAVGGEDADFQLNGQETDRTVRPAGLANARGIFAIYVSNDSMYPAWRENALVYVTPHRPPAIGDDVIIELHPMEDGVPGKAFLKRLKARTPSKYIVEQFNPPGTLEFERDEVRKIYRVIPYEEALGLS
ncbi:phage repressor protein C with HTH and peptisase S24 domain [Methylobacterium sp. BE186]|uniref:XRE family transcriptional regulator n=1 Tax=Methylobacterium sp. BE186 TaxID=2817715 RepID=UPI0028660EEF|nr:helix-turn-helix domain-containing protein [Methylobacterium sp. BE186]MDR7037422.1 phage repressor protein C with HTH and peptisase S24 domain [Methylobacterium sp. BE186]